MWKLWIASNSDLLRWHDKQQVIKLLNFQVINKLHLISEQIKMTLIILFYECIFYENYF